MEATLIRETPVKLPRVDWTQSDSGEWISSRPPVPEYRERSECLLIPGIVIGLVVGVLVTLALLSV